MKKKASDYLQIYGMLAPNVILFLLVSVYPVLWAMRFMFYEYDGLTPMKFVGLDNFIRLFMRDPAFWNSVKSTLVYAGGKILSVIPLAFLSAVLLNGHKRGDGLFQATIFTPTIMSSAVMSLVFYLLFNVYNGQINTYLLSSGLISEPINWLGKEVAMKTVVIVAIWGAIGNYMVYFLAGLQQIPTETYESAEIDGANMAQRMAYITIPMLGPVLKTILMLSILAAFQDMQSIMVLTEGGPFDATNIMFLYIYKLYYPISASTSVFRPQYGYGAAASIVAAAIIGVITVLYLRLARKLDEVY